MIDLEETRSHKRKEAQYSAAKSLISIPLGQFVGIFGAAILLIFKYQEGIDSYIGQPDSAVFGIKILIAIVPIVCSFIIFLTQIFNPLKDKTLADMKIKLLSMAPRCCSSPQPRNRLRGREKS